MVTLRRQLAAARANSSRGRLGAFAFSLGGNAYVGRGATTNTCLSDVWSCNPATDQWTPRAGFPGGGRSGSGAFTLAGQGYVPGGAGSGSNASQVWS